jgi:hypothetical protein
MRKRKELNAAAFISQAAEEGTDAPPPGEDLHRYVHRTVWPIGQTPVAPSLADGSSLGRSLTIALQEKEWNSIDRHTKALGIPKARWIRHAIFRLMEEEQQYCFRHRSAGRNSSSS